LPCVGQRRNRVLRDFNAIVEQFPYHLIASRYRFEKRGFFELETPEIERKPVKMSFQRKGSWNPW
ncbi:MAG: LemA family protein, partial [Desulfobacterales bacterium]|nr:LemA family protein [Desulfobacterales bacterium]